MRNGGTALAVATAEERADVKALLMRAGARP